MRETDEQKIERLEKVIAEQKEELTAVKKDKKRLNYAVERLEREKEKLSLQSSKEDTELIKGLEKQIENLKSSVEEKERESEKLKAVNNNQLINIRLLKKELNNEITIIENKVTEKLIELLHKLKNGHLFNKEQLERFNNGDRYFNYGFKDYPIHIQFAIFSTKDLIIRIHPKNGRELVGLDILYLKKYIGNRYEYLIAKKELEEFKNSNPSNDELVEWTYKKGMELLPIYEDEIF